jgi:prophage antirepressor-like protein
MNNITPFQFNQQNVAIITEDNGDILFIAKEIADILGYSDTFEMTKKLDDDEKSNRQIAGFGPSTGGKGTTVITESGFYSAILTCTKPIAKILKKWVTGEVLPSIRKTGGYSVHPLELPPSLIELQIAESAARMLRMSDTSKIRMLSNICEIKGVTSKFLPNYTDEQLTRSLGDLLKEHGSNLSAVKANPMLENLGLLEKLQRKSTKGTTKSFWNITTAGLHYGKNETSPQSPRETQPRWYVHKFPELLAMLENPVIHSTNVVSFNQPNV